MRAFAVGLFWVAASCAAWSESLPLPDLDVEAHCQDAASLMGNLKSTYLDCLKLEQSSYNQLKKNMEFRSRRCAERMRDRLVFVSND
mgnify:CR=1 FL=1